MILYHKGGNTAVRTCDRCQHGLNEAGELCDDVDVDDDDDDDGESSSG
jgi:hypothetical protein